MSARILAAEALLADGSTWMEGGGVLVRRGRVQRLLRSRAAVRRAARDATLVDLDGRVLTPGLVNAHVHLELSGLARRLDRDLPFGAWVQRLLSLRARRGARLLEADAREGAARCLATGTTLVGDIDSTGAAERGLVGTALRVRLYREVLDAQDPARTAGALARASAAAPRGARLRLGLAPHAPYSVSPELLAALGRLARRRRVPVSVHWAETAAEIDWLRSGAGPLAGILGRSPQRSGLDLLASAGLLGPSTLLVHGNLPQRGEPRRIALAGATLAVCPGSHTWFDRAPIDLELYERAGVRLALGTDSLASNVDLDLAREMALLRRAHPGLSPERVWTLATEGGARALGFEGRAGCLREEALADVVAWRAPIRGRRAALEALTGGEAGVDAVWVGGREALAG